MIKKDVEKALKSALVEGLRLEGIQPEDIDDQAPLFGDEGLRLDSLDAVELVVIVEKHFGVAIADAEEARGAFASLSGLAEFILARRQSS
ncbi:MAG: phosphopantetheine-binding protein [Betaproteobacteria bacterium]|nr:phosphopantetheine-binding protein [Betaproteobacteria bacterium]